MSRIIHTGDWHLGEKYPEKALASAEHLISQITSPASPAFNPDAILFGGDLTHRALHVHSEHLLPFYRIVDATACPIVLLQGTISHEPLGTINNLTALSGRVHVIDAPSSIQLGSTMIFGLPGLSKVLLAKWAREIDDRFDGYQEPGLAVQALLAHFGDMGARHRGPKILLGHWTLSGCTVGTGQQLFASDIPIGRDDLLPAKVNAVLLNHIHHAQDWASPLHVSYSGSPYPVNWGERDQKSFSVYEFDDVSGAMTSWQRISFPHKPMIEITMIFSGQMIDGQWVYSIDQTPPADSAEYEIKVNYRVPGEHAGQIDDDEARAICGQLGFTPAVLARTLESQCRERIADIGGKETTRDQYVAVCEAKGKPPRPGAIEKASVIDEEVQA